MWSIAATAVIALVLVANHMIHGWGCWGLQSGGHLSMQLYALQILVTSLTFIYALVHLLQGRFKGGSLILLVLVFSFGGMLLLFVTRGWMIMTSIHNQGPMNLVPFGAASGTAIWGGFAILLTRKLDANARPKSPAEQVEAPDAE